MNWKSVVAAAALPVMAVGCAHGNRPTQPEAPVAVVLGAPGTQLAPVVVRTGQLIALDKTYCPAIQLRNAAGTIVQELQGGPQPQKLVAAPGVYTIVGHAPTAGEWTRRITVTGD